MFAGEGIEPAAASAPERGRAREWQRADRLRHPRPGLGHVLVDGPQRRRRRGAQIGVAVSYSAPDTFSRRAHARLIDEAVADRPDGLVVSIPDAALCARRSGAPCSAGIPVVSINSGTDLFRAARRPRPRRPARGRGRARGRRADGARRASATRCASTRRSATRRSTVRCAASRSAMRRPAAARTCSRSTSRTARPQRRIAEAIATRGATASSRLGPGGAQPALDAQERRRPRDAREARHVRPLARGARGDARRADAVRGRPAALPPGLPADRDARPAGPLRLFPVARRAGPDRPELRDAGDRAEAMELSGRGIR